MNCVTYALLAFEFAGLHLRTVPSIAVDYSIPRAGMYFESVVKVRDPFNCQVMVHEFVHHMQRERLGKIRNKIDLMAREHDAAMQAMVMVMDMQERGFLTYQRGE